MALEGAIPQVEEHILSKHVMSDSIVPEVELVEESEFASADTPSPPAGLDPALKKVFEDVRAKDPVAYEKVLDALRKHADRLVELEVEEEFDPDLAAALNVLMEKHMDQLPAAARNPQVWTAKTVGDLEKAVPFLKDLDKEANDLIDEELEDTAEGEEQAAIPHPKLVQNLDTLKLAPHKWADVFSSKEYGVNHLLEIPLAKINCEQANALFTKKETTTLLRVPDVRGHLTDLGRTRTVEAEVIKVHGKAADANDAQMTLLLRNHRHRSKDTKREELQFIEGSDIALDPDKDVIMEATPAVGRNEEQG